MSEISQISMQPIEESVCRLNDWERVTKACAFRSSKLSADWSSHDQPRKIKRLFTHITAYVRGWIGQRNGKLRRRVEEPLQWSSNSILRGSTFARLWIFAYLRQKKKNALWASYDLPSVCPHVKSRQTLNRFEPDLREWFSVTLELRSFSFSKKNLPAWLQITLVSSFQTPCSIPTLGQSTELFVP